MRDAYKQLNPSKRAKFSIQFSKLRESESGYCSDFKIYTGSDKINSNDSASNDNRQ